MSGICGLLRFDGAPVPGTALDPMLRAMADLGTEEGRWAPESGRDPVALACRPIRVTPEDAFHHPPVRSPDGRLALVADVRLDNRSGLGVALGIRAADAERMSDADFLLASYRAWGDDCPRRLIGDFAFALWDGERRRLLCARDGIGHRLFYYHVTPQRFAFATGPTALLALDDVPVRLNETRVAESLVLIQDPVSTFFADVLRLPPGHTLTATEHGVRTARFWSPEPTRRVVFPTDEQYVEAFCEVFDEAVRAQTRSAGPVGVMVSGGLDSPSIAATAALQMRDRGERLLAFHAAPPAGFSGPMRPGWIADESADVQAVADHHPNLDLEIYRPTGGSPLDGLAAMFKHAGLPPRNPSNLEWADAIYASARDRQVRVLLAGHKGNATISYGGVRSLRDIAREGRVGHVMREVRAVARATGQATWAVLRDQIVLPLAPAPVASAYLWLRSPRRTPVAVAAYSAINAEFARATQVDARARDEGAAGLRGRQVGEREYRILALTAAADAPDLYSAARTIFGIETRSPACDLRVVDYCLSIPGSQYLRNGTNRWLIRRAMQNRLPPQVVNRTTRGAQGVDWAIWIARMRSEFAADIEDFATSEMTRRCLDLPRLRRLIDDWPAQFGAEHETTYQQLFLRGITMGRFIRWFERAYG